MQQNCFNCGQPCEGEYCPDCYQYAYTKCEACKSIIEIDSAWISNEKYYCEQCYKETFTFCNRCNSEILTADALEGTNSCFYCQGCFRSLFTKCHNCQSVLHRYDGFNSPVGLICHTCFCREYGVCEGCGEIFSQNNLRHTSNGWYCYSCDSGRSDEWDQSDYIDLNPTYNEIGSTRRYGIELETAECPEWHELFGNTIFGSKRDPSIDGMEFISPILYGDASFALIKDFCRYAKQNNWRVNSRCGYHLHIDVSNEDWQSLQKIALAYYLTRTAWSYFVPDARYTNGFCGPSQYNLDDIFAIRGQKDWDYFAGRCDRFEYVNWRSYFVHGSFEVRLHEGTLDQRAICNWVALHTKFIDSIVTLSLDEIGSLLGTGPTARCLASIFRLIGPTLANYYLEKITRLEKTPLEDANLWIPV